MAKYSKEIIKEIAEQLYCGMNCYYNPNTKEIITSPGILDFEEVELLEENIDSDCIKFEALESFESFKIMDRFINHIPDEEFRRELEYILLKKKPFQHFKHAIDHSAYRQDWFDFKQSCIEKIVKDILSIK